jgi:hypothetical protein
VKYELTNGATGTFTLTVTSPSGLSTAYVLGEQRTRRPHVHGVCLVGMPGSGKSTVGRQLARLLGWQLLDSDAEIERELGHSIRSHFEQHGEDSFRALEEAMIAKLAACPGSCWPRGRCHPARGQSAGLEGARQHRRLPARQRG